MFSVTDDTNYNPTISCMTTAKWPKRWCLRHTFWKGPFLVSASSSTVLYFHGFLQPFHINTKILS